MIATEFEPLLAEENERIRRDKISQYRTTGETVELVPPSKSRDEAGKLFNVSGRYVSDAEKIKKEAPEFVESIMQGEMTIKEHIKKQK